MQEENANSINVAFDAKAWGSFARFVAFDVETPNRRNDRMSAIGIAVVENGRICEERYLLVDPETFFDPFNVILTGITPEMAESAPIFPRIWEDIRDLMENSVLVAHNAPFDMRVLASCLDHYAIEAPRYLHYACTVAMGRRCYPELPDHKLDTLCRCRNIKLDHHHAGSDSSACASLLLDYINNGMEPRQFIRTYDLWQMKTLR